MTVRTPDTSRVPVLGPASNAPAPAVTPTLRQWFRRARIWVLAAVVLLVVATVWTLVSAGVRNGTPFASDNPGPSGGMALAEVLRQRGVDVTAADTLGAVDRAAAAPADTTILVFDSEFYLDADQYARLAQLADRIVVVAPTGTALEALAPDVAFGGFPEADAPVAPACDLPEARRAGAVAPGSTSFQSAAGDAAADAFCYPDGGDRYLLARTVASGATVTLLPDAEQFDNDHIATAGNASLALNLLGGTPTLVWYLPTLLDVPDAGEEPTLGELTPDWVTPAIVLLLAVFVAAAIWRGRRFGPLVVENLPVIVPAGETMEGRARLYQRSGARLRAVDALRVGAVGRMATCLGLPRTATVEDVISGAARTLGRPATEVRSILLDAAPATDTELVQLSDALLRLERDVRAATDPRFSVPGRTR